MAAHLALAPDPGPAARAHEHAVRGREAALQAVEHELAQLNASAERCAVLAELTLAPAGLRDLFRRHGLTARCAAKSGEGLLTRAREDGLL